MTSRQETPGADFGSPALPTRALAREAGRAGRLLAAGEWRPAAPDCDAAGAVLKRLAAPLPSRHAASARTTHTDRDRRLQRILRTSLHHLDAGVVSPRAAALLASVARAFLPWHGTPDPPRAAAAPRYGASIGAADGPSVPPTDAGEALLPGLVELFTLLASGSRPGTVPVTPPVAPWQVRYAGRFRHHGRPAADVWTAETFGCPACGGVTGPWTVTCGEGRMSLGCPCGVVTHDHGLAFSEVWLVLPDS
ncbi:MULTISPECIES: hypothetical protein [unclassified Streptomyces]|uniref:hypothetical protein n=1 Tax=unclassified Streptomyces TaxID=2593676 RepID=UPI001E54B871|nr:hypothetical protein [Streptomyces sp. CB02980]MCB8906935.1 hypothetical protein [Streptomyces sp. CB02980]